jgi:ubiquinone/menaquinone biosynthesis C-methylase UbiE
MTTSDNSSEFYTQDVIQARSEFFNLHAATDETTRLLIEHAAAHINGYERKRLLDIGTGNGFVLTEVIKRIKAPEAVEFHGVDLSEHMVQDAKKRCAFYPQITITKGNNFKLPFDDESFDVVTNKLSSHFSIREVIRVLKRSGLFVFKEYGVSKGFAGIAQLFKGRIESMDPLEYVRELRAFHIRYCSFNQFYVQRTYSREELAVVFRMAPIIKNFDANVDMEAIESVFGRTNIRVIADPFLIIAQK